MSSDRQLIECISRLQAAGVLNTPELLKIKADLLRISEIMQTEDRELQKYRYLASDHPISTSKDSKVPSNTGELDIEKAKERLEKWYG